MKISYQFLLAPLFAIAVPLAAQAQSVSDADRALLVENVAQADANGDGMLEFAEFETLIDLNAEDDLGMASRLRNSGRLQMAFNRIDADGDGVLTQPELQAMAEQARG